MTAHQALAELLEVSPQVEATVIAGRDGLPIASSFDGDTTRERGLASHGHRILEQADVARRDLEREPVVQCEIATGEAHVFVVADAERYIVAITGSDPTVGLVFYDLKTALRTVRESAGDEAGSREQ